MFQHQECRYRLGANFVLSSAGIEKLEKCSLPPERIFTPLLQQLVANLSLWNDAKVSEVCLKVSSRLANPMQSCP